MPRDESDLHCRLGRPLRSLFDAYAEWVYANRLATTKQSAVVREVMEAGLMTKLGELPKGAQKQIRESAAEASRATVA